MHGQEHGLCFKFLTRGKDETTMVMSSGEKILRGGSKKER